MAFDELSDHDDLMVRSLWLPTDERYRARRSPEVETVGLKDEVSAETEMADRITIPRSMTTLTLSSRGRSRGINFPDSS
jgi:hypothetical protein